VGLHLVLGPSCRRQDGADGTCPLGRSPVSLTVCQVAYTQPLAPRSVVSARKVMSAHHAIADRRTAAGDLVAVPRRQLIGRLDSAASGFRRLPSVAHHGAGDSHDPQQRRDHPRPVAPASSGVGAHSVHLIHILTFSCTYLVQGHACLRDDVDGEDRGYPGLSAT
jgi:hypothetical protein